MKKEIVDAMEIVVNFVREHEYGCPSAYPSVVEAAERIASYLATLRK